MKSIQFGECAFGPKNLPRSQRNIFFTRSVVFENLDSMVFGSWYVSYCWEFEEV